MRTSSKPSRSKTPVIWSYVKLTRLHKFPSGSILVFWPYGITLVPSNLPWNLSYIFLLACYGIMPVAFGMTYAIVILTDKSRSKARPLASGSVSLLGATVLFLAHLAGCAILVSYSSSSFGYLTSLICLLVIDLPYPLMKRWTNWPQAWLGISLNWGLFVSSVSINTVDIDHRPIAVLFIGSVCWTIYCDTIYACQDKQDDVQAGVKSTALLFGDHVHGILTAFSCIFVCSLALAGHLNSHGPTFFVVSVIGSAIHFAWQLTKVDFNTPESCSRMFESNGLLGCIVWLGMLGDYFLHTMHFRY